MFISNYSSEFLLLVFRCSIARSLNLIWMTSLSSLHQRTSEMALIRFADMRAELKSLEGLERKDLKKLG